MKTLFIDFGNVLGFFDHTRAVAQLVAHTDLDAAQLDNAIYGGTAMDDYESGRLSTAEFTRISKDAGRLTCHDAEFVRAFADIFTPNRDVCQYIPALSRHYRLVLASNTCAAHYERYCIDFADTLQYFDYLCASHLGGARKPSPAFYRYCQLHADADPAECLFVDDLPGHIAAASAHGWKTVHYLPAADFAGKLRAAGVEVPELNAARATR